jgi:geranylgeranylglycerol-phosphate geranylgeranyltransferase
LLAYLIAFLSAAGTYALNDYFDYELDKSNNKHDRPLVSGLLSKRTALVTGLTSFLFIFLLSLFLIPTSKFLVLFTAPLFIFYNLGLKRIIFVKNILVAYAFVATILLGSVIMDSFLEPLIVYFALMAFIVGFAVETMVDMADVKGDKEMGIETISTRFGIKNSAYLSILLYFIIMVLDPLPFFVIIDPRLHFDYVFLFLILIPVVSYFFISRSLIQNQSIDNIKRLRRTVFYTMQIGCIAYLVGVLL